MVPLVALVVVLVMVLVLVLAVVVLVVLVVVLVVVVVVVLLVSVSCHVSEQSHAFHTRMQPICKQAKPCCLYIGICVGCC